MRDIRAAIRLGEFRMADYFQGEGVAEQALGLSVLPLTPQIARRAASLRVSTGIGARSVALLGIAQPVRPSSRALLVTDSGAKRGSRGALR